MYQRDGGEGNTNNKTNIRSLSSPHILQQQAGGMEAQQTASHKHKNLSWDVRDSWNLFIQHPRASLKCYPTTVSGQRFSASPGRKDLERKVPGNWTQEQALADSAPASKGDVAYCKASTARSRWQQDVSSRSLFWRVYPRVPPPKVQDREMDSRLTTKPYIFLSKREARRCKKAIWKQIYTYHICSLGKYRQFSRSMLNWRK